MLRGEIPATGPQKPLKKWPEIRMGKGTYKHPGFQGRIAKTSGVYLFLVRELHHKPAGSNCTTQYPLDQAEMVIWLVGIISTRKLHFLQKTKGWIPKIVIWKKDFFIKN